MKFDDGIFGLYSRLYDNRREVEFSLEEYLGKCSDDPSYYAGAAERMLRAIGEPVMAFDVQEAAADPVQLMYVIEQAIWRDQFPGGGNCSLAEHLKQLM